MSRRGASRKGAGGARGSRAPAPAPAPALPALPFEVVLGVLRHTLHQDPGMAARLLALNQRFRRALQPHVYTRVELATCGALAKFAQLVRVRPEAARAVRALWIGPSHTRSDLLTVLSAPLPGDSAYLDELRDEVYRNTRFVLRACRRLQDVALSGSLVSKAVVDSYGTACQPVRVTSVNPHSFISGFDAPIFQRVEVLTVCDINLSLTEADAIRRLPALRSFEYISPKDYGEVARDIRILEKLLALDERELPLEDQLERLLLDVRPTCLQRLQYRAVASRAAQVVSALELAAQGTPRAIDIAYADLAPTFVEEWEALRDLVFNAQDEYSRAALGDDVGSWVDPSHALEQLRSEWRTRTAALS
ncbi:hypothetical protein MOBT1_002646 [Malassezia obtusa]|uniref:Uncharacterized protein n=1 Tax=Malassezia obtusa TaxID=76774 RepID=A0AAF0IU58_9BASI|nr:hypothetical protein MOBT1_002646 [Malassezia obtusa]